MKIYLHLLNSKVLNHYYWSMKGSNGECMGHSETIENTTYLKKLMARFKAMGFVIVNKTKLKIK